MISLKQFEHIITTLQKQYEVDSEIDKALQKVCGSYVFFQLENKIYPLVPMLLKEIFNDKGEWIEYWIQDCEFGTKYGRGKGKLAAREKNGKYIDIETVEKLYKYLLKESKK